ncbi:C4-dicarboxylate ABC transporter permease [Brucella pseudogrignonensis]|uniref:TRAP transporter large permease n=1 Tax=Brucella pseudogrignonensis TaxID=419475 RepID=UPI0007DA71B3|nr:TRAP transporter large permease subunit [Brucella pseudogrignonensis]ANG98711.1 C4-dicarboxylate ABC transporter permease [Brucella pseudogrignonensis]
MTPDILHFVVLFGALIALFATGMWISVGLIIAGGLGLLLYADTNAGYLFPMVAWGGIANWTLTALPLFIWMGEILFRTRLSSDLFRGIGPFVRYLPGRLLHVNVFACGVFAAVSGSSAATTATIGRMSLPELKRQGYDDKTAIGSLAGAGTLGLLIPPSIMMIVYGVSAQVSINRLFVAGVVPGLMLMAMFSSYIALRAMIAHRKSGAAPESELVEMVTPLQGLKLLAPTVLLIAFVIGSIYAGIATATEAAAIGVLGSLVLALATGTLTLRGLWDSIEGALQTTAMIGLILVGAAFLTKAMSFSGMPAALTASVVETGPSPAMFILMLTGVFIILGCFLDGISIIVLTSAVILPAIKALGIDPLWFGIYLILVVEMAQITPPLGMNLFVIQSITGHNILRIAWMTFPFFLILLAACALIWFFPGIVTWPVDLSFVK